MSHPLPIPKFLRPQLQNDVVEAETKYCQECFCVLGLPGVYLARDEFLCRCGDPEFDCYD